MNALHLTMPRLRIPSVATVRERFDAYRTRAGFGTSVRANFYHKLSILLQGGSDITSALRVLYEVHSDEGAKPHDPVARVTAACIRGVEDGVQMSVTLEPYASVVERSIISAGEEASGGELGLAFERAVKGMGRRQLLADAVTEPLQQAKITGYLSAMMVIGWSFWVAPQLQALVSMDQVASSTLLMFDFGDFIRDAWLPIVVGAVVGYQYVKRSLPGAKRTGDIGKFVDKLPPYSIYRIFQGTQFIDNLATLLGGGVPLITALENMVTHADPWLRARVEPVRQHVENGKRLSDALRMTGYEFPDRESIAFLNAIQSKAGNGSELNAFAERWVGESVKRIRRVAGWANIAAMMLAAGFFMLMVAAVLGLTQVSSAGAGM